MVLRIHANWSAYSLIAKYAHMVQKFKEQQSASFLGSPPKSEISLSGENLAY